MHTRRTGKRIVSRFSLFIALPSEWAASLAKGTWSLASERPSARIRTELPPGSPAASRRVSIWRSPLLGLAADGFIRLCLLFTAPRLGAAAHGVFLGLLRKLLSLPPRHHQVKSFRQHFALHPAPQRIIHRRHMGRRNGEEAVVPKNEPKRSKPDA